MVFARAGVGHAFAKFLARYPRTLSERLLQHAGVGPKQLANADEWLSFHALVEAFELGAEEAHDPWFGQAFAETAAWADMGPLAGVILNSPTVGAALSNACRFFAVQQTAARPHMDIGDGGANLAYVLDLPDVASHAQHSQQVLTMAVRLCREGSGDAAWTPREVHFKHSRPDSSAAPRQFFRCPIVYDQPCDALILTADDLRIRMRSADPALLPDGLREATDRLGRLPVSYDFADHVSRIVLSSLSSGDVTIEHVAARVGSSPRTLQRRLRDRGFSFNDVVANTRLELCRRYLGDTALTLTDVAFLLGYSDLSAFSRAFRRWTGSTAIEYRRDLLRVTQPTS